MEKLSAQFTDFYLSLQPPRVPKSVQVLHPQTHATVQQVTKVFFQKFYHDHAPRQLLLGINPGRFGAGITGINFTAPLQLSNCCGIAHPFGTGTELSAEFIYQVIAAYGDPSAFFGKFFLGAMSPLGYIKDGKNINYYDDAKLQKALLPFIVQCISRQQQLCGQPKTCICIGEGKNLQVLNALNHQYQWFSHIIGLPHPRFVMQYRKKQLQEYVTMYVQALQSM